MTVSFQNGSFLGGSASASSLTTSGGVTASSLYDTEYLDRKYDYADTRESYEIAYSGRDAAIETKISNIGSYLANGKEDKALAESLTQKVEEKEVKEPSILYMLSIMKEKKEQER